MSAAIVFFMLMLASGAVCSNSEQGTLSATSGVFCFFFFVAWLFAAGGETSKTLAYERQMNVRRGIG
jgi:hypothetical protein